MIGAFVLFGAGLGSFYGHTVFFWLAGTDIRCQGLRVSLTPRCLFALFVFLGAAGYLQVCLLGMHVFYTLTARKGNAHFGEHAPLLAASINHDHG